MSKPLKALTGAEEETLTALFSTLELSSIVKVKNLVNTELIKLLETPTKSISYESTESLPHL